MPKAATWATAGHGAEGDRGEKTLADPEPGSQTDAGAGEHRREELARDRRRPGDGAGVIGLLGPQSLVEQPGREHQSREAAEFAQHLRRVAAADGPEPGKEQRQRKQEHQARAQADPAGPAVAERCGRRHGTGGRRTLCPRAGRIPAAEALTRHQKPGNAGPIAPKPVASTMAARTRNPSICMGNSLHPSGSQPPAIPLRSNIMSHPRGDQSRDSRRATIPAGRAPTARKSDGAAPRSPDKPLFSRADSR